MRVTINHTGHQGTSTAIDHGGAIGLDWRGRNFLDQLAFDQHIGIHQALFVLAIENMNVGNQRQLRLCLMQRLCPQLTRAKNTGVVVGKSL